MRAWLARGLALLAALASGSWGWIHVDVERRVSRVYEFAASPGLSVATASIERGRHLAEVVAQCTTCHGDDLSGREMADDRWLGRLWAPNLTPGRGGISARSDADLDRAIRHGLRPDGTPLLMMPSNYLFHLGDSDVASLIAYLRTLAPVDRQVPERRIGPLSRLAIATGRVPDIVPAEILAAGMQRMSPPSPAASADYGAYLVETAGCKICHHADLSGGLHPLSLPDEPPPPDLRPSGPLGTWTEADFIDALRTGSTPDGRRLDPAWMPWPALGRMSDLELGAIWKHLQTLDRST